MPAELFLIAGGRENRRGGDPLLADIFSRIGLTLPTVAYVGAASGDSRVFFMWISALLKKAGAGPVGLVPLASRRADPVEARSLLERSDIIFVSGGDVDHGMRILEKSGMAVALRELHRAGKPFIGLSAGSIMLARSWVRWADASDDASAEVFPCLGLVPVLCDTHAEKEEWEELKVLLKLTGADAGYGIPAGAALHMTAGGALAAIGKPVQRIRSDKGTMRIADELTPSS